MKEILKLVTILSVTILLIIIGNKVIYENNFAIIEGSIVCNANTLDPLKGEVTYTSKEIDFPQGFNKDNCIVLSLGGRNFDDGRGYSYKFSGATEATDLVLGTEAKRIELGSRSDNEKINLMVGNISTEVKTKYYRIVLMKIK